MGPCGAISLGSENSGGIYNVTSRNIVMQTTDAGMMQLACRHVSLTFVCRNSISFLMLCAIVIDQLLTSSLLAAEVV
jgi:hypothetical protein